MQTKILCVHFLILLVLGGLLIYTSCSSTDTNENSAEKLSAYCIRECVLETGDSEICDTRCGCASKYLSEKLSKGEFSKLVIDITKGDSQDLEETDSEKQFKNAIKHCK